MASMSRLPEMYRLQQRPIARLHSFLAGQFGLESIPVAITRRRVPAHGRDADI